MTTKGIYIYGIVPNFYSPDMFRSMENLGVYAIPLQNISAIVSDRDSDIIDYKDRENLGYLLVDHQETIEELMELGFNLLIPMQLGTIVKTKEEVFKILSCGHEIFIETLKKIEFLTEIDLAVTWNDFPSILQEVANHTEILALKEKMLKNPEGPSQNDQMEIGMLIHSKLKEKNKTVELRILDSLITESLEIRSHEVMDDMMVTNCAFLINRKKKEKFEKLVDQLDEEYKDLLKFKLVGPLPCYSFYTIEVKELNLELVSNAKKELGLGDETTESEIKKAYLEKAKLFHPDTNQTVDTEESFSRINKAYHILLDYSMATRQSSKVDSIFLTKEKVSSNLILIKIKE
jgi:hypothetical protein